MSKKAFVVICKCGDNIAAYDPERSDPENIGKAVQFASEADCQILLIDSPVKVVLGKCKCEPTKQETT